MKDVILRNMERLIDSQKDSVEDHIEAMTSWKWHKLYKLSCRFGVTPWIADGIRIRQHDFFMQIPDDLRQQFFTTQEERSEENLEKFRMHLFRSERRLNHFKPDSLVNYAREFKETITNIEE